MENNDYIRQRDGDGTKAAQRRNVWRPNGSAQMSRTADWRTEEQEQQPLLN